MPADSHARNNSDARSDARNSDYAPSTSGDYYEILGVARTATTDEINAAYKKKAKTHHPDRHASKTPDEQAAHAEQFKTAAEAHETLADGQKRSAYDLYGKAGVGGGRGVDDAAAQAMFEQMFMGAGAGAAKKRRMHGGALFVDASSRGSGFFQRSWDVDDLEKMRDEMASGLPDVTETAHDGSGAYVTTTTVPYGSWEVRFVEVDVDARTVCVALCAAAENKKDAADGEAAVLRVERTFTLPADADVDAADVTLDEATGVLSVKTCRNGTAAPTVPAVCEVDSAVGVVTSPKNEVPAASPSTVMADDSCTAEPMFVVGEEPAETATPKPNRAARRRAKHDGLKAGFLNAKPKRTKASLKENEQPTVPVPPVERQRACKSPVSVRDDIEAAMRAQVDALMQGV